MTPSTPYERLVVSALRKQLMLDTRDDITSLARLDESTASNLLESLARLAGRMCAQGDPVTCGMAAWFYGEQCRLDEMAAAHRSLQSQLAALDQSAQEEIGALVAELPADTEHARQALCPGAFRKQ